MGQNIAHIRQVTGHKQEYVASELGITQPQYSKIERSPEVEERLLNEIAEVLGVKPEVIKNFNPERVPQIINGQYNIYNNEIKDNATNVVINSMEMFELLFDRLTESKKEKDDIEKKSKSSN
jgi:transcriptional regulator with XRE-family HTH domain